MLNSLSWISADFLRTSLQSQLRIERIRLGQIELWNNSYQHMKLEYNICSAVIDEIEQQLKELELPKLKIIPLWHERKTD